MPTHRPHTALLVFSLSAKQESRRKHLLPGQSLQRQERLFQGLINHTQSIAEASGLDWVWLDEHQQRGTSFGERLANAFADLFEQGYEAVISIGNDSPGLSAAHLRAAREQLTQGAPVLGPNRDGGVYLIGLRQSEFRAEAFTALPWTTRRLARCLDQELRQHQATPVWLGALLDLDTAFEVHSFLQEQPRHQLSRLIARLLSQSLALPAGQRPRLTQHQGAGVHSLRAPPPPGSLPG